VAWRGIARSELADSADEFLIEQLSALWSVIDPVPPGVEQNALELFELCAGEP
jgi:hypothetical protein